MGWIQASTQKLILIGTEIETDTKLMLPCCYFIDWGQNQINPFQD